MNREGPPVWRAWPGVRTGLILCIALGLTACAGKQRASGENNNDDLQADVVVIGAGIAGLAAALEAANQGANVIVAEVSSVPGGHAVKAGGFALVDTPLQRKKGHSDSPDLAYADLMAWGENPDEAWVRQFVDASSTEIHDWLTELGVKFSILLDTPEDTVPRFHFAGGTAVNVVIPMLQEIYSRDAIKMLVNTRVEKLSRNADDSISVIARNTRTGLVITTRTPSVVIATGGFQSNLELVRNHLPTSKFADGVPLDLLIGSGQEATGSALSLGNDLGAATARLEDQATFVNGLPDPRNPARGLKADHPVALRVNAEGQRFINESANSKQLEHAVFAQPGATHWLVFDQRGLKRLRISGAAWLTPTSISQEILNNPAVVSQAPSIDELARAARLPVATLVETIERYNSLVANANDEDFGRFRPTDKKPFAYAVEKPPYYAVQLRAMTRKSLGGLAIDKKTRVLDQQDNRIEGLFAAGEATGVAGINGRHGGSGTFLAPSVLTGRYAGRAAAQSSRSAAGPGAAQKTSLESQTAANPAELMQASVLRDLIEKSRSGYWHFEQAHQLVIERQWNCARCHSNEWPAIAAATRNQKVRQLQSCTECH